MVGVICSCVTVLRMYYQLVYIVAIHMQYVYICMHTCVYITHSQNSYVCTYICHQFPLSVVSPSSMSACSYFAVYTYVFVHTYVLVCVGMFLYRFVHVCMCLSVHICMCVVCVHVRTYIPRCVLAAVVLAGTSGSGKSVCIDTVVSAVNSLKHHSGETAPVHVKLHRLYPMVFEDLSALYGQATPEGDWKDGVFSALLRKALQVRT